MKKKGVKKARGVKHHAKLLTLIVSKLVLAFLSFSIGIYIGSAVSEPRLAILIAFVIAILIYVLSIMHVMKWLKI